MPFLKKKRKEKRFSDASHGYIKQTLHRILHRCREIHIQKDSVNIMKSPHLSTSNINRTSPPATQILKTALTNHVVSLEMHFLHHTFQLC